MLSLFSTTDSVIDGEEEGREPRKGETERGKEMKKGAWREGRGMVVTGMNRRKKTKENEKGKA